MNESIVTERTYRLFIDVNLFEADDIYSALQQRISNNHMLIMDYMIAQQEAKRLCDIAKAWMAVLSIASLKEHNKDLSSIIKRIQVTKIPTNQPELHNEPNKHI
jgi:hypothetical protein